MKPGFDVFEAEKICRDCIKIAVLFEQLSTSEAMFFALFLRIISIHLMQFDGKKRAEI